jgi:hypothetical protein
MSRVTLCDSALMSCLFLSSVAIAANAPKASVSGSANGINFEPSSTIQKQAAHRQPEGPKVFYKPKVLPFSMWGATLAAGAPGVEGARGTESGR